MQNQGPGAAAGNHGWHKIVKSVTGWHPESEFVPAIVAAVTIYLSVYFIGLALHQLTKHLVPNSIRGYVLDFVKTMTFCSYPFGHGIIRKYYGEMGYMGAMIPVMYLSSFTMVSGDGNPISVWTKYFKRAMPISKCIIKTSIQIVAGFAAYRLGMYILGLELHPVYLERLKDYYSQFCSTDLKVPMYVGFILEFFAVVYDSWFSSQVLTGSLYIDTFIKIVNSGLLVVGGVHLTGMYMHPAMATGHTWGCGDTPRATHILIYWVAPMIGVWLSVQLQRKFSITKSLKTMNTSPSSSWKPKSQGSYTRSTSGAMNGTTAVSNQDKKRQSSNATRRKFYHN